MQQIIQNLPTSSGVYQYFDKESKLLYIGKAKNLKNRVKSYWRFTPSLHPNPSQSHRIIKMLTQAVRLEYMVVESETDALVLENSLIKQLKPKYNILLRDDKTYPYIYIDNNALYPRFEITRKRVKGKNITYYGPFPTGAKALFDSLYEIYPLVQMASCLNGDKACLFYQIKKCLAPCEKKITPQAYQAIVTQAKNAITQRSLLIEALEQKMGILAIQERYEEAGVMRDRVEAISKLSLTSNVDLVNHLNLDIFAIQNGDERGVIVKLFMRDGKIVSSDYSYFRQTHIFDKNEAYKQALLSFYSVDAPLISKDILTADDFEERLEVAQMLSMQYDKKIKIQTPQRGAKAKLIALALQNCEMLLKKEKPSTIMEQKVAHLLDLGTVPYRIESFDNSHMMGQSPVGGMVVWSENKWERGSYRRYSLSSRDEVGQMREMLSRRIADFSQNPPPDLWILDGGKANLNIAQMLLKEANVNLDVIAIAKEKIDAKAHRAKGSAKDILYTNAQILQLLPTDKRLHWIQRQRDEAHRYAITYHQNKKRKTDIQISLLNQKGVGRATLQKLIDYFGSFEAIENASMQELEKITNKTVAKSIKKSYP